MNDNLFVLGASTLFYFYWIMSLDTLFKSFEITKVISYSTTTFFCIVNEFTEYKYVYLNGATLCGIYTYELVYYKPDKFHTFHHIVSYIITCYALSNYIENYHYTLIYDKDNSHHEMTRLSNLFAFVNISSIFSALRQVLPCEATKQIYYYIYLLTKICFIMIHYNYIYTNIDSFNNHHTLLYIGSILHMTQLYFCYKIIKILYNQKRE